MDRGYRMDPSLDVLTLSVKILGRLERGIWRLEHIEVIATKGFSEKDPYAASFFKNFKLTDEQLSELMYYMEDGTRTESRSARAWLEKHPEIIKLFLPSQENQLNGSHETN